MYCWSLLSEGALKQLHLQNGEYLSRAFASFFLSTFPSPGDLPNPGIEPRSPSLWVDFYQLSHKGSPRILEWVAYPFSSRSSQPRNLLGVSCIAGRFFTNWAIREACVCSVTYIMYVTEFSLNFLRVLLEYVTSAIGEIWELPKAITWRVWVAIRLLL